MYLIANEPVAMYILYMYMYIHVHVCDVYSMYRNEMKIMKENKINLPLLCLHK